MDKQHFKEVFPSKRDGNAEIADVVTRQFIGYLDKECEEEENSHSNDITPRDKAVPSISGHLQAAKARSDAEEKKRQSELRKYRYQYEYLGKLLKGCTKGDDAAMENIGETRDQVVCYHDETRTTYINHDVPWPVVFLLTRYHRKFIRINKRIPPIKSFVFQCTKYAISSNGHVLSVKNCPRGQISNLGKGQRLPPHATK